MKYIFVGNRTKGLIDLKNLYEPEKVKSVGFIYERIRTCQSKIPGFYL